MGAIELIGKKILRIVRSVVSELRMYTVERPNILPLVQYALKNAPSPQSRNTAPVTSFMG